MRYSQTLHTITIYRVICDRCGMEGPNGHSEIETMEKAYERGWQDWSGRSSDGIICRDCVLALEKEEGMAHELKSVVVSSVIRWLDTEVIAQAIVDSLEDEGAEVTFENCKAVWLSVLECELHEATTSRARWLFGGDPKEDNNG